MTAPEILIRPLAAGEAAPNPLLLLADPAPDLVAAYLKEGVCVVATVAQSIVAVYVLRAGAESAEIKNIAVAPDWEGQGIGKRLIANAARRAAQMGPGRLPSAPAIPASGNSPSIRSAGSESSAWSATSSRGMRSRSRRTASRASTWSACPAFCEAFKECRWRSSSVS